MAALLTVALLPLGLIALDQTRGLSAEAERRAGLSLLSLTRDAADPIRQSVERALGAAEALAAVADTIDAVGDCPTALSGVAGPDSAYGFVAIVPRDGAVTCSTSDTAFELEDRAALLASLADPRPRVGLPMQGQAPDVLVVTTPFGSAADQGPRGEVALSVRRDRIGLAVPGLISERPLGVVIFNEAGEILDPVAGAAPLLPAGLDLSRLATEPDHVFPGEGPDGEPRVFTVATLLPGTLWAMGVWTPDQAAEGPDRGGWGSIAATPVLFPLGMWLASLLVAFWAANRLVVRPVAGLVGRMRRFGADRSLPDEAMPEDAPRELREIDAAFRQTAHAILQDEARMENAFRERGVLLREIHHRVKNNLQLISSIISMQMRRAPDPRTRLILRRLQDRVLTLASIYRSLYTSPDMSETSVAPILRAIVEAEAQGQPGRVAVALRLDDLVMDADKAVPLAFLVAEAVSNAVQQAAQAQGERQVSVTLAQHGREAQLTVLNTVPSAAGPAGPAGAAAMGTPSAASGGSGGPLGGGLGSRLIEAFTVQLGGRAEAGPSEGAYRLRVVFPLFAEPGGGSSGADEPKARLSA